MADPSEVLVDPAAHLSDPDETVRRLAISIGAGNPALRPAFEGALHDPSPRVRAEAAEVLGLMGPGSEDALVDRCAAEDDPIVVEALATALGEVRSVRAVDWLVGLVSNAGDRLVGEAAVAALGAIGAVEALPVLLGAAAGGAPQVRRRAVVALTAFDDPAAEAAILAAREDRNPMVREVAEMIAGKVVPEWRPVDLRPRE
jgi:HEAT repeat protein